MLAHKALQVLEGGHWGQSLCVTIRVTLSAQGLRQAPESRAGLPGAGAHSLACLQMDVPRGTKTPRTKYKPKEAITSVLIMS